MCDASILEAVAPARWRIRKRLHGFAGRALIAAVLTACGPTQLPTPLPASIDPCGLLTEQQASALNGVTYGGGSAQTPAGGASNCSWDNAAARATVEVTFSYWPNDTAAQAAFDAAVASASQAGSTVTTVAGLADAAVIAREGPTQTVTGSGDIFVRRGALLLTVNYYNGTIPTDSALEAVAIDVLRNLPQFAR